MSRSARLTFPGGVFHVISRCLFREPLLFPGGVFHVISRCLFREPLLDGEDERSHYLALLSEASQRTDARVLSYCLIVGRPVVGDGA